MPHNSTRISSISAVFLLLLYFFVLKVASFIVLLLAEHLDTSLYLNEDPYVTSEI